MDRESSEIEVRLSFISAQQSTVTFSCYSGVLKEPYDDSTWIPEGVRLELTQDLRPGVLVYDCLQALGNHSKVRDAVLNSLGCTMVNFRKGASYSTINLLRRRPGGNLKIRTPRRLASTANYRPNRACGNQIRRPFLFDGRNNMNDLSFAELMSRVRAGDEASTNEIMQRYGTEVRRIARVRLRHGKLRRVLESSDILQSVMGSFFRRADHGEYEDRLSTPDELLKLLATMVRFKVIDQVRRASSDRRGGKFDVVELIDSAIAPSEDLSPDQRLIQTELIELVKDVMSPEEWELWRLRHGDNLEWVEIAQKCGGSAESNRKKLERLQERLRVKFADRDGD